MISDTFSIARVFVGQYVLVGEPNCDEYICIIKIKVTYWLLLSVPLVKSSVDKPLYSGHDLLAP